MTLRTKTVLTSGAFAGLMVLTIWAALDSLRVLQQAATVSMRHMGGRS